MVLYLIEKFTTLQQLSYNKDALRVLERFKDIQDVGVIESRAKNSLCKQLIDEWGVQIRFLDNSYGTHLLRNFVGTYADFTKSSFS